MYNGIPLWKTLGESAGKISLKPDDSVYKPWHKWMKDEREDDFNQMMTQKEGVNGHISLYQSSICDSRDCKSG